MANLAQMKSIRERFADRAVFLTLYTQEAHPTEGGDYIDYFHPINHHRGLQDRLQAAEDLLDMEPSLSPLVVDNMKDEASIMFGSFPDRLYIVVGGIIQYQGGVGPHGYKPKEVEEWLSDHFGI